MISENNKKELLSDFVNKLPAIRKKLGLSQSELGEKVGLSRQSISSIERGTVTLSWNIFLAIALVVFVNDSDIFEDIADDERYLAVIESLKIN